MDTPAVITKSATFCTAWLARGFGNLGLAPAPARVVAEALVEAELWDRPTHGFTRVFGIAKALRDGCTGTPSLVREGPSFAILDAGGCLGYVASVEAADLAARKAIENGLAAVGVRHSSHNGMLGYYLWRMARAGVVGLATTHCLPFVAAFGSSERVLGTNPIAFAFPPGGPHDDPVIIDLATSALSWGELTRRRRAGEALPKNTALDKQGLPTTDAAQAAEGRLLPFGGSSGEGKGSALGLAVELLSSVLVGEAPWPVSNRRYGHFFLALRPGLLNEEQGYAEGMQAVVERIRSLKPRPGQNPPRPPGARAMASRRRKLKEGLAVDARLWEELRQTLSLTA